MNEHHEKAVKTLQIEGALLKWTGRDFSMGNDLLIVDDLTWDDLYAKPLQLGFLMIAVCTNGEASFKQGEKQREIRRGDIFISLGEQVISDGYMSPEFHGKAVLMSRSYVQDCIVGLNYMWPYLLYLMKNPVIHLTEEENDWIMNCYSLLRGRLYKNPGRYMREALTALTRAFYFEVCNLLDSHINTDNCVAQNRSYAIFDRFIRLVSTHFKSERSVEWYSSELCLTPKHLSEVVKSVSGKTAGQWISSLVMIEIKTYLQNTTLSIKEIAREMSFPNQSFLGKYFKNIEGVSPSDFRKRQPCDKQKCNGNRTNESEAMP